MPFRSTREYQKPLKYQKPLTTTTSKDMKRGEALVRAFQSLSAAPETEAVKRRVEIWIDSNRAMIEKCPEGLTGEVKKWLNEEIVQMLQGLHELLPDLLLRVLCGYNQEEFEQLSMEDRSQAVKKMINNGLAMNAKMYQERVEEVYGEKKCDKQKFGKALNDHLPVFEILPKEDKEKVMNGCLSFRKRLVLAVGPEVIPLIKKISVEEAKRK